MPTDEQLRFFEWMWTTHKHEFCLVEIQGMADYLISRITEGPPRVVASVIIEDDDVYRAVQVKLVAADVNIVTPAEHRAMYRS